MLECVEQWCIIHGDYILLLQSSSKVAEQLCRKTAAVQMCEEYVFISVILRLCQTALLPTVGTSYGTKLTQVDWLICYCMLEKQWQLLGLINLGIEFGASSMRGFKANN